MQKTTEDLENDYREALRAFQRLYFLDVSNVSLGEMVEFFEEYKAAGVAVDAALERLTEAGGKP